MIKVYVSAEILNELRKRLHPKEIIRGAGKDEAYEDNLMLMTLVAHDLVCFAVKAPS